MFTRPILRAIEVVIMVRMTRRGGWLAVLLVGGLAAMPVVRSESTDSAAVMLEAAVQAQLVDGDLGRAIKLYQKIVANFGDERPVAAKALLDLGQCYEQLGDPKARSTYERLLREYGDRTREASAARTRLAGLEEEPAVEDPSEVIVREVWERPQPGLSSNFGNPRFVIFSDLAVLKWNQDQEKPETRRLSSAARSAAYPVLSPDQRQVAHLSWSGDLEKSLSQIRQSRAGLRSAAELRIVGVDGSEDRAVYRSGDTPWLRPLAWSPDGEQVLTVLERRDGTNEMALVSAEDGSERVLKSFQGRSPKGVGFSRDGRRLVYELPMPRNARKLEFFVMQLQASAQRVPKERRYAVNLGAERTQSLTDDQQVIHVLNRLSFGPRPGDIERVRAMGVKAYIEQQLYPERIPDPVVAVKLETFSSLTMGPEELLERLGPAAPQGARRRAAIFEKRAMAQRRAAGQGRPVEDNTLMPTSEQARRRLLGGRPEDDEIQLARMLRAVYSERQLLELMVDFWMNHFNINHGDHQLTAHFEEQVIRRRALGSFETILMAVAKHPRMLNYLDNWRSSAPAEVIEKRIAALKPTLSDEQYLALQERMPFLEKAKGLNENYARELMELHTLGIDGGYTQQDVIEVAKILTGWTISGQDIVNGREDDGVFAFDPLLHVDGDKVVLGETIRSGGIEEGERLLRMLARHPSTARFIATKLARRFVADDPPAQVVEAASRTFQKTGGDIREVLRTIFTSAQFRSPEAYRAKIKKPLELVVSSLRAVKPEIVTDSFYERIGGRRGLLAQMGERLYSYETPDGNPDVGAAWMNSNALLLRLDFANTLAMGQFPGVEKADLKSAQALLGRLGLPTPTAEQIEATRAMMQTAEAGGSMEKQQGMMMGAGSQAGGRSAEVDPAAIVVAAMLGSPQFQKR